MTAIGNDRADRFWPTSTVQEIQVEAPYSQFPFNKLSEAPRGLAERNQLHQAPNSDAVERWSVWYLNFLRASFSGIPSRAACRIFSSTYPSHLAQVCHLGAMSEQERQALLQSTEVGEVWGVGRRIGAQLQDAGIRTVWDLAQMNPSLARQRWSVVLEKTIRELQGTPCFTFEDQPPPKQQIACTRSFGHPVTGLVELQEAITAFACRAAEKLRQQNGHAGVVMVFIRTSPFRQQDAQYSGYRLFKLLEPTSDSARITQGALAVLRTIYKPGFNYAKAGVMLMELSPASQHQLSLFTSIGDSMSSDGSIRTGDIATGRGAIFNDDDKDW